MGWQRQIWPERTTANGVRALGDVFIMKLTRGGVRENPRGRLSIEGRRISWRPAEPGPGTAGTHLALGTRADRLGRTRLVTHTYDWTELHDEGRLPRARATTADRLRASLERLAALAEQTVKGPRSVAPNLFGGSVTGAEVDHHRGAAICGNPPPAMPCAWALHSTRGAIMAGDLDARLMDGAALSRTIARRRCLRAAAVPFDRVGRQPCLAAVLVSLIRRRSPTSP